MTVTASIRRPSFLTIAAMAFLFIWLAIAAVPFLWTLWGSFKVQADFFSKLDWQNALYGVFTLAETGGYFTDNGYEGAWIKEEFWRSSLNTMIMTFSVVAISLTLGTLGGYALSRSGYRYAFWVLIIALVFRAMPHITLVSGYLLPFFQLNLYGHLGTTIVVMVAINQPFTLWMLHSFFQNIPKDLDESAMVDGCTRFQAFRYVIIPHLVPLVVFISLMQLMDNFRVFEPIVGFNAEASATSLSWIIYNDLRGSDGNILFGSAAATSLLSIIGICILLTPVLIRTWRAHGARA